MDSQKVVYEHTLAIRLVCKYPHGQLPEVSDGKVDVAAIVRQMESGDYCGMVFYQGGVEVPSDALKQRLLSLGDDGDFFDGKKNASIDAADSVVAE